MQAPLRASCNWESIINCEGIINNWYCEMIYMKPRYTPKILCFSGVFTRRKDGRAAGAPCSRIDFKPEEFHQAMDKETHQTQNGEPVRRGGNQITVRSHNERLILDLVRKNGELSKTEAARMTGLSNNATSVILRALEDEALLLKGEPIRGKVGQPSVPMRINPAARTYLAFRIGRRSIELALLDFTGQILASRRQAVKYPTPSLVMTFFNEAHIPVLRSAKVRKSDVSGLSVVMPFELWSWTDEFDAPVSEMMDWKTFDIEHELSQQSPYTVAIENDGTAACRAELMFGKHQNKSDWIYFYVGTFIGGGVVLDQKLFAGKRGNAGGFGPMRVPEQNGKDRLVDHASLVVLEKALASADKKHVLLEDDESDWSGLEPEVSTWIDRAARSLAHAIVSSLSIIDFEGVVIDGSFPAEVKTTLVDAVKTNLKNIDVQGIDPPYIEAGSIGPSARLLGAAALQIDLAFPPAP